MDIPHDAGSAVVAVDAGDIKPIARRSDIVPILPREAQELDFRDFDYP